MFVEKVLLSSDVFRGLLVHSFITDQEEVLGLLFGSNNEKVVSVWGSVNLKRNCKEKDRVEVEDIQLSEAMDKAEHLSQEISQTSNLIGWFHSHPNITVFPSHVDLRTQLSLQTLGENFIGIIISCFSRDSANVKSI
jgi:BRCA1/BRCA2-containing complex subunit 3